MPSSDRKAGALLSLLGLVLLSGLFCQLARAETALAMHGEPKYGPDFTHFSYVNPNAPKGGALHLAAIGSFNSLNPFLVKGVAANGLGLVYQSLLRRGRDEPFTLYAGLADSYEIAPDRRWITFSIDARARFSDGRPVTVEDVHFSYETLRSKGRPNHRTYYGQVGSADILDKNRIRFTFKGDNIWELPLILGLMPIMSRDYYETVDFSETTLQAPVGTGPYVVDKIEPGRQISYKRNPDFWGKDLPVFKGRYNFDTVTFDYFRDRDVALEAFKAGQVDAWFEDDPGKWTGLVAAQQDGAASFVTKQIALENPAPMLNLVFNTRRPVFAHRKTREALITAYDFEWTNANLFHGLYKRTSSYFQSSELAAHAPPSEAEIALLTPFKDELPAQAFTGVYTLPVSDGSGRDRRQLRAAKALLQEAGWQMTDGKVIDPATGAPLTLEVLVKSPKEIRLLSSYQKTLARLGITLTLRLMDSAGYQNRITDYDYDMMIALWDQSLSPGNEQDFYWSRAAAATPGTRNYPGIRLKAVDHLIGLIRNAKTRSDLVTATRALDRTLIWGQFGIPLHHVNDQWLAHGNAIHLPDQPSFWGTTLDVWWYVPN